MHRRIAALALTVIVALPACSSDDAASTADTVTDAPVVTQAPSEDGGPGEGPPPEPVAIADPDITVTGADYVFQDLPAEVEAGTTIGFTNDSDVEAHELVIVRLPDDETRPAEEVWPTFEPQGPPALVAVAAPGEAGLAFVGDGTVTEPGRYLAVCFLPVGGDPAEILEGDGPPDSDAPPHAAEGMVAEFTVA